MLKAFGPQIADSVTKTSKSMMAVKENKQTVKNMQKSVQAFQEASFSSADQATSQNREGKRTFKKSAAERIRAKYSEDEQNIATQEIQKYENAINEYNTQRASIDAEEESKKSQIRIDSSLNKEQKNQQLAEITQQYAEQRQALENQLNETLSTDFAGLTEGFDQQTQSILNTNEALSLLAENMTPEQFEATKSAIEQYKDAINDEALAAEQATNVNKDFNTLVEGAAKAFGAEVPNDFKILSVDELLNISDEDWEKYKNNLKEGMQKSLNEVNELVTSDNFVIDNLGAETLERRKINSARNMISQIDSDGTFDASALSDLVGEYVDNIADAKRLLQEQIQKSEENINNEWLSDEKFKQQIEKIKNIAEQYGIAIGEITNPEEFDKAVEKVQEYLNTSEQTIDNLGSRVEEANKAMNDSAENTAAATEKLYDQLSADALDQTVQGFTDLTSAVGGLYGAAMSAKSVLDIWNDDSLSGVEKAQQLFGALSGTFIGLKTAGSGVVDFLKKISAARAAATQAEALQTTATQANTAANIANAASNAAGATSEAANSAATRANTANQGANTGALGANSGAKLVNLALTGKLATMNIKEAASHVKAAIAAKLHSLELGKLIAKAAPILLLFTALAAAATAWTIAIIRINNAVHAGEKNIEDYENSISSLNKQISQAKQTAEEFSSAFDNLKEQKNALDDLTKGTEEWNNQLEKVKESTEALLEAYPELKQYATYTSEGWQIDESALENYQQKQQENIENLQIAKYNQEIGLAKANMLEATGSKGTSSTELAVSTIATTVLGGILLGPAGAALGVAIGGAIADSSDQRMDDAYRLQQQARQFTPEELKEVQYRKEHENISTLEKDTEFMQKYGELLSTDLNQLIEIQKSVLEYDKIVAENSRASVGEAYGDEIKNAVSQAFGADYQNSSLIEQAIINSTAQAQQGETERLVQLYSKNGEGNKIDKNYTDQILEYFKEMYSTTYGKTATAEMENGEIKISVEGLDEDIAIKENIALQEYASSMAKSSAAVTTALEANIAQFTNSKYGETLALAATIADDSTKAASLSASQLDDIKKLQSEYPSKLQSVLTLNGLTDEDLAKALQVGEQSREDRLSDTKSSVVEEAARKTFELEGGEYLTGEQQQEIIDKLEDMYSTYGRTAIDSYLSEIEGKHVEVALKFEYKEDGDSISEEIQKQLDDAKISIDEFNSYKNTLTKLNPDEEISDQSIVNTLVSQKNMQSIRKDENFKQKLEDYQAGKINIDNIEALDLAVKTVQQASGEESLDADWVLENLDAVLNYINNSTDDAREVFNNLVNAKRELEGSTREGFASLFQNYDVKVGEQIEPKLQQEVEDLAKYLKLDKDQTRALFEQYGYLQTFDGKYEKVNSLQLQIEQAYNFTQGEEKTETEWKELLGLDKDANLEELGFTYKFTIPNGPRVYEKTDLLSTKYNTKWDDTSTVQTATLDELIEKYGTNEAAVLKQHGWHYNKSTQSYERTVTAKEALKLDSVQDEKMSIGDAYEKYGIDPLLENSKGKLVRALQKDGCTNIYFEDGILYYTRKIVERNEHKVDGETTDDAAYMLSTGDYDDSKKTGKKKDTPEVDIFRDVNAELERYNTQLERLQKNQKDLTGKDLEDNLKKQTEIYKQQADAIERKLQLSQQEFASSKKELSKFGVSFNEEGYITNGADKLSAYVNDDETYKKLEKAISKYENALSNTISLQDDFNEAIRNAETKKYEANLAGVNGEISESTKAFEKAQKEYEKFSKEFENMTDEEKAATNMTFGQFMSDQLEAAKESLEDLNEKKKQIEEEAIKLNVGIEFDEDGNNNIDEIKSKYASKLDEVNEKLQDQNLSPAVREELEKQREEYNRILGCLDNIGEDYKNNQELIEDTTEKANEYARAMDVSRFIKENTDVYYDVNKEMDGLSRQLSHLQKASKGLEGTALISNLRQQSKIIDQQIKAQKTKIALAEKELEVQQGLLQTKLNAMLAEKGISITAKFDEAGMVDNYQQILDAMKKANGLMEEDIQTILDYITSVNQAAENSISIKEGLLDLEYSKEDIQQQIQDVYSSMAEEGQKAAEDAAESMEDELNKRLEWFNMKVDVELDISDAVRRLNDLKKRIQGLEDNDILGNAVKNLENLKTYFTGNINSYFGSMDSGAISGLTSHLNAIMGEIGIMQAGGESSLYGTDQSKAFDDLNNYRDQLMDQLESVEDLKQQIEDSYLQMIDKIADKLSDIADDYKQIDSLIQHDMNLIKMVYGENSFDKLALYFDQKVTNDMGALAQARKEQEYWKALLDSAEKGSEAWDKYYENYKNATNNLNSLLESSIQDALDQYNNLVNQATSDLTKKLSGGYSQDYIDADWEHATMMSDKYLDNINKAYEIQSLRHKMNTSISDTASLQAQQKIRDVMEEQLKILEEKEYVTQYDVDRANKIYDITMKQIALEEAQNNKSQMKLRRDSQGNYRYEYVSDQDDIAQKEQELLEAQNNLYNFDKDRYREVLQEAEEAYKEYSSKYVEILNSTAYTEEEKKQLLDQLNAKYYEAQLGRMADLGTVESNLLTSADKQGQTLLGTGITTLKGLVKEADTATETLVHNTFGEDGPINTEITKTFDNLRTESGKLQDTIKAMLEQAGVDFEQLTNGMDPAVEYTKQLVEDNKDLLASYDEELIAIQNVIAELANLEEAYNKVKEAAIAAIEEALKLREQESLGGDPGGDSGTGSETGGSDGGNNGGGNNPGLGNDNTGYIKVFFNKEYTKAATQTPIGHYGKDKKIRDAITAAYPNVTDINGGGMSNQKAREKGYIYKKSVGYSFDTGGYTGDWNSKEGKIAMLHEKELVLNKQDTSNILMAVSIVRTLSAKLSDMTNNMMNSINSHNTAATIPTQDQTLEQNVKIEASFPNVKNSNDIEQALNNLVNTASMYAMRTKR